MYNLKKYALVFLFFILLTGCEEVVQVDLKESEPRLVVEASLIWFKNTEGNQQQIRITETTGFYDGETTGVENAVVRVTNEEGVMFAFDHTSKGIYTTNEFIPEINSTYELEIEYDGNIYTATEKMIPVSGLDYVEQTATGGFAGDEIEIKAYYTDPEDEENYYLFKFIDEMITLEIYEDEFTDGNQIFGYYSNEDIKEGDIITILMEGISKRYYEYLFILRSQIGTNDGGPFETMPATVKGNIINRTDRDNFPFGYFRLSEADSTTYIVN